MRLAPFDLLAPFRAASFFTALACAACAAAPSNGATGGSGGGALTSTTGSGGAASTSGTGPTSSGSTGSGPAMLGSSYLFYYVDGGVAYPSKTPNCDAPLSFGAWAELLAPTRLDITTTWPSSLYDYRVITVAGLGSKPGSTLADADKTRLVSWVEAGGTVLFLTDYGWSTQQSDVNTELNALLASIGVGITVDGPEELSGFFALTIDPKQPLGQGVGDLACGAATRSTLQGEAIALDATHDPGKAVLAMQTRGAGRVVVLADQTCVSDYTSTTGTPPAFSDCALTTSAPSSLGAFLKALARP